MAQGLQPGYLPCGADGKDMGWTLERGSASWGWRQLHVDCVAATSYYMRHGAGWHSLC